MSIYPPLSGILEQTFEDFDAHFERLRVLTFDHELNLADLVEFETRMRASLDALRTGGEHLTPMLEAALESDDTSAIAAATWAGYEIVPNWFSSALLEPFGDLSADARVGVALGLRQIPIESARSALERLSTSDDAHTRACVADVLSFHRCPAPDNFADLLDDPNLDVRRLSTRAAGRWASPAWKAEHLGRALAGDDEELAAVALETSAQTQLPELLDFCREAATAGAPTSHTALRFLGIAGDTSDAGLLADVVAQSTEDPDTASAALEGLGALGFPTSIPTILHALANPQTLRAAGAAFLRITGAEDLEGDTPIPPPAGVEGDDADLWDESPAEVDAANAANWWSANGSLWSGPERVQAGRAMRPQCDLAELAPLPLATRRAEYLRLAFKRKGLAPEVDFEHAPSRQLARA